MSGSGSAPKADDGGRDLGAALLVALVVLTVGLLIACTVIFPRCLVASDMDHATVSPTELAGARNDVRATLLQGFGGMVLLVGAYLTWRQTQISRAASREELQLTREGQLTDRFTRAVEQLGSGDVAVRVGGIYALGRIADESVTDRASIADLLTAYVRRNAPWPPPAAGPFPADIPLDELPHLTVRAPDIQAILTVLGRRRPSPPHPALWTSLDLTRTDLRRSSLPGLNLWRVRFREASLAKAWLFKADLRGVDFRKTDLRDANLREATADLTTWWPEDFDPVAAGVRVRPDLENADLRSSDLKGADLTGVSLRGARANAFTEWPDGFDWRQAGVIMDDECRRSSTAVDPSLRHRRSPTAWENAGRDRVE
jgi:Pentapeptide repeats (8 copies)